MNKRNILSACAAFLALGAAAQTTYTPPLSENFNSSIGQFQTLDSNNDKFTFKYTRGQGVSGSGCMQYLPTSRQADDWLITPRLELKAGKSYTITYQVKSPGTTFVNKVRWMAGTTSEAEDLRIALTDEISYPASNNQFAEQKITVSVPSDGNYYLGMHLISDSMQGPFTFDEFSIAEAVDDSAIALPAVSDAAFAVESGLLTASFSVTLPSATAGGTPLASGPLTLSVLRADSDTPVTVQGEPGAVLQWKDPAALTSATTYTFTCTSADKTSAPVTRDAAPRLATPDKPQGFTALRDGSTLRISWAPVTTGSAVNESYLFAPGNVRYAVKCGGEILAELTDKCELTYAPELPEKGQLPASFTIVARLGANQSEPLNTPVSLVGEALKGEFRESFSDYTFDNLTWLNEEGKSAWNPTTGNPRSPKVTPQDKDNGCLVFSHPADEDARIYSPILNLTELTDPQLRLWIYMDPSQTAPASLRAAILADGRETLLGEPVTVSDAEKAGWKQFAYKLPSAACTASAQIVLIGGGTSAKAFVDNITLLNYLQHNVAVSADAPAPSLNVGEEVTFNAVVDNKGVSDEQNVEVSLYADDTLVDTAALISLPALTRREVSFPFTVAPRYAGSDVVFRFEAKMASDLDESDNTASFTVPVAENDLPAPESLTAEEGDDAINLTWRPADVPEEPLLEEASESFESWTAGSILGENGWIFADLDELEQTGLNSVNSNARFAAMVAENFDAPNASTLGLTAHDGTKCLAVTRVYGFSGSIDNWIISPKVAPGEVAFYVLPYTSYENIPSDKFSVYASSGSTDPSDFVRIAYLNVTEKGWNKVAVTLPEGSKRFAIRVSGTLTCEALCFDSFSYTAMTEYPVLKGFNIYRDHEFVATLPADATAYADSACEKDKEHTYHATALYDWGESCYSSEARASLSGIDVVDASEASGARYYTLQGVSIQHPAKGDIVIEVRGSKARKVIVK